MYAEPPNNSNNNSSNNNNNNTGNNNNNNNDSNNNRPLNVIDIIFSNRNKKYGAYYLRKQYPRHLRIGVIVTFSVFFFLISLPYISDFLGYSTWFKPKNTEDLVIIPVNIDKQIKPLLPPPPKEQPKPPKEQPKPKPPKEKIPKAKKEIVPNNQLPIDPSPKPPTYNPDNNKPNNTPPESPNKNANQDTTANSSSPDNGKSTKIDTSAAFFKVDQLPLFPGGMTALHKYMYNNIKYPAIARKDTVQGMVTASFIVQEDGTITDVNILDAPPNCNECRGQVIKNLYKMPEWVPGKRNGKAIKVRCLIKVNFELEY